MPQEPMPQADVAKSLTEAILGAMPDLSEKEQTIAVELYRILARGKPVEEGEIARSSGIDDAEIQATLEAWPGIFRDEEGRIIGFWGLAVPEMPHHLEVDGVGVHTWCAWDPLFIVPLLEEPGRVESKDPVTGETVSFTIDADGVRDLSPHTTVVSFLMPEEPWDHDVIQGFCHYVLFFAGPESGEKWVAEHPGTFLLSTDEAFEVGRRTNAKQFGRALAVVNR